LNGGSLAWSSSARIGKEKRVSTATFSRELDGTERHRLLEEWNATRSAYPQGQCIHELFEEQVQRRPQAVALVQGGDELTYGELNAQANRLARHLRELGVKPEERVAICVERGAPLVVGLLAVWKAGGAYVPLDPEYPGPRLRYMLEDSAPVAVLTQGGLGGGWSEVLRELPGTLAVLDLMAAEPVWGQQSPENLGRGDSGVSPEHLAYVIYTSGSTGTPKGVMVEHRPLTVRLLGIRAELSFGVDDTLPHLASPAFDISLLELLLPLVSGGRSLMLEGYQVKDLARLVERTSSATVLHAVPSLMETWLEFLGLQAAESHYPLLRTLLVGGEAVSEKLLRKLRSHFPGAAVIELYGPTEATVISSSYRAEASELPGIPYCIGRPLPNTRIYILDDQGCPVPVGVSGEIYIGGVGVARGYLNRAQLTAQRFVRDRFVPDATARMYRSGDLGRWLPDGRIEYLGRNDFQVKVRGFRIEPGEIEARLLEHPGVREAVVLAREDIPGEKRLVAYYVSRPDGQSGEEVAAEGLRAHLRSGLPEYMLPAAYVRLESLPLTPNGKLDRKGLPEPGAGAYAVRGYEAPQGQLESILAGIWAELLKLERVGRHDNFFALGGHSLLAVRLMERMRRQGLHAEVRALFAAPTLAKFAAATEEIEEIHL
jgi:amino acid adenylation domain-containing protein